MDRTMIKKAEMFLIETFANSAYFRGNPSERDYRLQHSYRVANIAKNIAENECLDEDSAIIAGLLHDISYCEQMCSKEDHRNHGRRSAQIARPFLETLHLTPEQVNDICYAIAIHVDDQADFNWKRSAFSETIGDADNIDRFDVYRIYEGLHYSDFRNLTLKEKRTLITDTITRMNQYYDMKLGTKTAEKLWKQRLDYCISYYERLGEQLKYSDLIF